MTSPETIFEGPQPAARQAFLIDTIPTIGRHGVTFSGMSAIHANHPWGIHHAGQALRYSQHHDYGRTAMLRDLGSDAHPVQHMQVVHDDVVALGISTLDMPGAVDLSDPVEIAVARGSSLRHDAGECTHEELKARCGGWVIGDIAHGSKTPDDRDQEYWLLETVLSEVDSTLPDWYSQRLLDASTHHEETPAHLLLETAHTWGFYKLGLRAGRLALAAIDQPHTERTTQLAAIAATVTGKSRPELEAAINDFPILEQRLEAANGLHDRIAYQLAA